MAGKGSGPKRDKHREARLVADAAIFGKAETARRHGVSERTVYRAIEESKTDPQLGALVRDLAGFAEAQHAAEVKVAELSWHAARHRFLSRGFDRLTELLETEPTQEGSSKACALIRAIADALDKGGSLDVAHGALNGQSAGADREGREASPTAGASSRPDEERHAPH